MTTRRVRPDRQSRSEGRRLRLAVVVLAVLGIAAVVTARHVVQGCKNLLVMKNRNLYPVRRAVIANNMDIPLLFPAIDVAAPAVIEADNTLHDGDPVYFLGDNDLRVAGSDRPMIADAVIAADQAEESTEYIFHITGNSVPGYSGAPV